MTGTEEQLSDALHGRVDHRELPSTPMSDVVATAGRIRRRRRVRTGVVTAAVVAVLATPFVLDAVHRPDTSPAPADPPWTDQSSTGAPLRVRLADVALGKPPAIAWLDGSDYVAADGTRTTLPVEQIRAATPYGGGFLVAKQGAGQVTLLDNELRQVWRKCAWSHFAVSDDGLRTAYQTTSCPGPIEGTLHFGPTDGTDERTAPTGPAGPAGNGPVGFLGDAVVVNSNNLRPPVLFDPDGTSTSIDALRFVTGVDEPLGLVSGQLASGGELHNVGAVVDPRTGAVKWQVPGWGLHTFSPDGSMVVGTQLDKLTLEVAIFDAETGERLHEFVMPRWFRSDRVGWEDDEHLLIATTQVHAQAILRTTLDGAIQRATEVAPYDPEVERLGLAPNLFP
jgi:hypothetical protein